jgi:TPP-dependent pyruvate/acetoin dehydrogenase alpha subunit
MACANIADRGPAYAIPAETVDGNDVFAVYHATQRAAQHARAGLGPYLLECKTFRMTGHSAHDSADYVPPHLFAEWAQRDPLALLERRMLEAGWISQEELERAGAALRQELDAAIEWAERSPYPDPAELLDNVYDPGTGAA